MRAPARTWILDGVIMTQDPKRRALRGHLLIEGNRIAKIAKSRPPAKALRGAKVVDASGLTILPGFVQPHVHLCQTLFRNQADDLELLDWLARRIWVMEAAHDEETLHTSALLGIHELLSSGTTCILDMGTVKHTEAIYQAVKESGIRANVGKCLMDHPKTTPRNLREPAQEALAEAVLLHKKWHGACDDRIRASYAPRFVISCTDRLWSDISQLSREQGALVHTHASENLKEIQMVKRMVNCENVECLHQHRFTSRRLVLAHCIWLKRGELSILKRTGTHVVHCPSSNMKLASGFARVPEMLERGINVGLAADGAPCNNNLNQFTEMRMAALIHKPGNGPRAMRAQEVLDMATRNGAKALGWDRDIGSIQEGKRADLVALDLNAPDNTLTNPPRSRRPEPNPEAIASSVVYSTQSRHVRWTMVDGRTLFSGGRVKGLPSRALLERAAKARARIHRRVSK